MTKKLTRAALLTALAAAAVCLGAWVPRGGLALAALAALAGAAVLIECGLGWAIGHFAAAAILALLLSPDKLPALWFVFVFGPWPVLKHLIERLRSPAARWLVKLAVFAACAAALYFAFTAAFTGALPQLPWYALLPALCAVFIAYDIAFSRLIGLYMRRIHRAVK
jgi:hypothetical protein